MDTKELLDLHFCVINIRRLIDESKEKISKSVEISSEFSGIGNPIWTDISNLLIRMEDDMFQNNLQLCGYFEEMRQNLILERGE